MRRTRLFAIVSAACLTLGLTTLLDAPAQARPAPDRPEPRTPVAFPTGTTTDALGNTVLADRQGRALQLRGTNLGKVDDIHRKDVADMGAAGFMLLRLPIQWRHLEPTRGTYDRAYVRHIRDVLRWAERYHLMVLVDWHQDVYSSAFGFHGAPEWTVRTDGIAFERAPGDWFDNYFHPAVQRAFDHLWNDADLQQAQVAAWTHLAKQLRGEPALLGYDLFNEPMTGRIEPGASLYEIGAALIEFERTELPAMYKRVIAGIRSVDKRSWLWVEPTVVVGERMLPQENVGTSLPGFDDPRRGADRIGYAPHAYSTEVEYGGDWDPDSGWVDSYEAAITRYPRKHKMPVLVGEWGPITTGKAYPGNEELVDQQAASFTRFASGWAMWYGCRNKTGGGYCVFTDDQGHLDPGRAGAWAPYAVSLAGRRIDEKATTRDFRLTYRPRPGTSTFIVPSGYAKRIDVRVSDRRSAPAEVGISRPTRTGARTVTVTAPRGVRGEWTVRIAPR